MIRFFLILLIINESLVIHSFDKNPRSKFSAFMDFIKYLKPSSLVNLFESDKSTNMTDFYVNEEQKEWFLNHLAKREELAKIVKKIYIIITFKKMFKFFLLMIILFFLPVFNSDGPVYDINAANDDSIYDVTSFLSIFLNEKVVTRK